MKGRPLCVASVLLTGWILLWHLFMPGEEYEKRREEMNVSCQVEQIQGQAGNYSLVVCDVMRGGERVCERMKVYGESGSSLFAGVKIGQILSMEGTVFSFSTPGNPGQFNEYKYYRELGIQYKYFAKALTVTSNHVNQLEQWLFCLRSAWQETLYRGLPEEEAGIVSAMVLGEKSGLSDEVKDLYKKNGIAHILAISGLHVSLLGAGLFFLLRRYVMPMKGAAVVTAALLLLYGGLTGFPVATKRAVFMMFCVLGARFLGRRYDRLSALALSALVQLLFHPALLFQSGFLMSYGTVLGIAVFLEPFQELGVPFSVWEESAPERWKIWEKMWSAVMASGGIFLVTFPILLYSYYEWNPYSFLVNVMILPFVGALILLAVAGSLLGICWPLGGRFLLGSVHGILRYYQMVCEWTERLPFHRNIAGQPQIWQVAVYYGLMAVFCYVSGQGNGGVFRKKTARIGLLFSAVFILLLPRHTPAGLTITNLDVGQGDCACLQVPGSVMLVDGGSSDVGKVARYRIVPFLKSQGIGEISYVFLTHSDSDHIGGIREILEDSGHMGLAVGTVVVPDIRDPDPEYLDLLRLCSAEGVAVRKMKRGDVLETGGLTLRCLHPSPEYQWESENDYSLVLQIGYGTFRGLFTGDLEMAGESEVLPLLSDVDYLKVSHHGSKGASSSGFLLQTAPRTAVISAGEGNRYGHPAGETLSRLDEAGAAVYVTMDTGAVTVRTDGEQGYRVETYRQAAVRG